MKLTVVKYCSNNNEWKTKEYLPSNSRHILVYSPEFGTSIGFYNKFNETGGMFEDLLRVGEEVNIKYWRELPRYNESNSSL